MTTPIIIVGYRNPTDIATCLASLEHSVDQDFAVIVVENGGPGAYEALISTLGASISTGEDDWQGTLANGQRIRCLLSPGNLGYAGAINSALHTLDGERAAGSGRDDWHHVWILNPDTEPDSRALTALHAKAADDRYGIIGSRVEFAGTGSVQMYGVRWRRWLGRGLSLGLNASSDEPVDEQTIESQIDFVSGASMLVSRTFIAAVGLMRDDYFLYFEDVDWCLRRGDFRLGYAHDSIIQHHYGSTIGSASDPSEQSALSVYLTERNRMLIVRRFFMRSAPVVVPVAAAFIIRLLVVQRAPAAAYAALRGWIDGLRNRTGPPPAHVSLRIPGTSRVLIRCTLTGVTD